jgi:outer membrane protein assembly factor BamB
MSTHDDLDLLLPELDGPASPDPAFAAGLRRQFVSAAGHQPTSRPAPIPLPPRSPEPIPVRPSRRRWLDLAAVAVLLLSMIGGLTRVTNTATTPTPAIQAPDVAHDGQMVGRSAAGDGQVWGPAPNADRYEQLWTTKRGAFQSPAAGAVAYASRVYRIPGPKDLQTQGDLVALDLRSGTEVWKRTVDLSVSAEVTPNGVIAAFSASDDAIQLALLDLKSGEPIWATGPTFQLMPAHRVGTVLVVDGIVIFTANDGKYSAFDLSSGALLWSFTAPRNAPVGLPAVLCTGADRSDCIGRTDTNVSMVAANGTFYLSDLATGTISARSINTGRERWSVSTGDRSGSTNISFVSMIAVNEGVVVTLHDAAASDITPVSYWGLWSAADGQEAWTGKLPLGDARMISNGVSLYALFKDPATADATCCDLAELNVATGAVTWTEGSVSARSLVGYLSDEDTLVVRMIGGGERLEGLNATTHQIDWTRPLSVAGCYFPVFPLSADGLMPCLSNTGQLSVYQPVRNTATPTAATPEPPVTASGSAAMDGTIPGPAPANGEYRLRWRGPGNGFVASFDGTVYELISRVGPNSAQGIVALDAETGAERWYQPVSARFGFEVTSAGVIVGISDSPESGGNAWDFHVALLDLNTGEPIWRSAESYQLPGSTLLTSPQVAGGSVLFVDGQMRLVAIDLATGQERWRVESEQAPPNCVGAQVKPACMPAGPAILGDMVYFDNPVTGQIVAVSLSTGTRKWAVADPLDRTAQPFTQGTVSLAAVDQGVLVNTWALSATEGRFGLWSAADGSVIWQWDPGKAVQSFARVGDDLVALVRDPGASDWHVERIDLMIGDVLQRSSQAFDKMIFVRFLPDAGLVLLGDWDNRYIGLNPASLEVTWAEPEIEGCMGLLFPVLPGGAVICYTKDGLAVYTHVPGLATPSSPSPQADIRWWHDRRSVA